LQRAFTHPNHIILCIILCSDSLEEAKKQKQQNQRFVETDHSQYFNLFGGVDSSNLFLASIAVEHFVMDCLRFTNYIRALR
jgi:hypothetical protein